jgi:hypothetical protein
MISNQDYLSEYNNYSARKLEIINISDLKGIKSNLLVDSNQDNVGNFIYVAVPDENIIYVFGTYIFGKNKDYCLEEFNNFLTTVNIKK